jgi:hypothetical protein
MRITTVALSAALVAAFTLPSSATVRITSDPGGEIGVYLQKFELLRNSGQDVIIDGPCLSACTMVLGVIPRDHLCVTSRARLGFHAAWRPDAFGRQVVSPDGTELLMTEYPPQVRDWIARRGGLTPHLMYLTGSELASMYSPCQRDQNAAAAGSTSGSEGVLLRPLTSTFASSRKVGRKPFRP